MASAVGSGAAVPFWRAAGMTYISYSNICANMVRNCLKEPFKSEALTREKVHFSISKWDNGVPQKPMMMLVALTSVFTNAFPSPAYGVDACLEW
ncbi:ATP synthase subunit epsilon, mitochondrial [Vitis vinifera]|uniref:ATP synthase subunit epsilon, mitochondrial n=1 Tax=Vitis vinifera TaxID=29760 RepID=A0A438HY22_VITVI|nr:ATP synthase subunit epsilon, mitochondrial [Vitis vinifera]RVW89368.1 ATP synthase subunit epsilon, mitochondrial [Vitis vinifera]